MHRNLVAAGIAALVLSSVAACWSGGDSERSSSATTLSKAAGSAGRLTDLKLDPGYDYGKKYANGILPVGDGNYVTDAPKKGSVYLCRAPQGQAGGAGSRGPWFTNNNTEYDINKKIAVEGNVSWDSSYSETVRRANRVITTNDLPRDHTTGVFPVQPSDPAYQYDRNPNQIASQSLTYTLNAAPSVAGTSELPGRGGRRDADGRRALRRLRRRRAGRRRLGAPGRLQRPSADLERVPLPHAQQLHSGHERRHRHRVRSRRVPDHRPEGRRQQHPHHERSRRVPRDHQHDHARRPTGRDVSLRDDPGLPVLGEFRSTAAQPPGQPAGPSDPPSGPPAGPPG